jgi:signal transduction histidine kinase
MRQATIRAHQSRATPMNDGLQLSGAAPGAFAMAALLYSPFMASTAASIPTGFRRIFAWPRVRFTLIVSAVFGLLMGLHAGGVPVFVTRAVMVGSVILLIFGALEQWPRRLPKWLPRTVLRLVAIALSIPFVSGISTAITGGGSEHDYGLLIGVTLLFAPWIAIGTILRQRDAFAREQALEFDLQRSEFERRESDARLRLLQAQVEPHFLFNTLANIQALVDSGSPQASKVLTSLIAYLRAAVPRMHAQLSTLASEVELARAYLDLMQMRIPDRLQYAIHIEPAAARLECPPMTLLTLVENAVRHGIDPAEKGGRIDADIWLRDGRCVIRVTDTGVGLNAKTQGLGTGLSNLRERLRLAFGGQARFSLSEITPHGVCAEISFPEGMK